MTVTSSDPLVVDDDTQVSVTHDSGPTDYDNGEYDNFGTTGTSVHG